MNRRCILSVVCAAALASTGAAAAGPEYTLLDREAQPLKARFNAAGDKVRIIAYVSPTCGGCLRGVDQIQKQIMSQIHDRDLEVYVVWVPKNGAQEKHVPRVTELATDARVAHYWDDSGAVVKILDDLLGIPDRACAGAFLVYGRGIRWERESPPPPTYWADAHAHEFEDHGPPFDAEQLGKEVEALLR